MAYQWDTLHEVTTAIAEIVNKRGIYMNRQRELGHILDGELEANRRPTNPVEQVRLLEDLRNALGEISAVLVDHARRFKRILDTFRVRYVHERNLNLSNQLRELGQRLHDVILMANWDVVYLEFLQLARGPLMDTLDEPEIVISSDSEPDDPVNDLDYESCEREEWSATDDVIGEEPSPPPIARTLPVSFSILSPFLLWYLVWGAIVLS